MKKTNKHFSPFIAITAMLALVACNGNQNTRTNVVDETPPGTSPRANVENRNAIHGGRGVITDIDLVRRDDPDNNLGLGALAGAVVGGIVGNQIGGGSGRTIATVAGAGAGAYAGHQIEKRNDKSTEDFYRYNVRMDNGNNQRLLLESNPGLRVGDRVRISDGVMRRD